MNKTLRSLAELPRDRFKPAPPPFVAWDPGAYAIELLGNATATLSDWLHARLEQLVREKVALERITVASSGGRTVVSVDGQRRFEFKIKVQMEGK